MALAPGRLYPLSTYLPLLALVLVIWGSLLVLTRQYRSHRTVDEGYNSKDNFNAYRVRVQNMLSTTTTADVQNWVNKAKADKTWLVLVYHRIASPSTDPPGQF